MHELYDHYVTGKRPAQMTHGVVTDLCRGRISPQDFAALLDALEANDILDQTEVPTKPQSEWDEEYLRLLSYESVGGTFSRQYLTHLAEVAYYVNANAAKQAKRTSGRAVALSLAALLAVIIIVVIQLKG